MLKMTPCKRESRRKQTTENPQTGRECLLRVVKEQRFERSLPGRIRTPDLRIRSAPLCPAELRAEYVRGRFRPVAHPYTQPKME